MIEAIGKIVGELGDRVSGQSGFTAETRRKTEENVEKTLRPRARRKLSRQIDPAMESWCEYPVKLERSWVIWKIAGRSRNLRLLSGGRVWRSRRRLAKTEDRSQGAQ